MDPTTKAKPWPRTLTALVRWFDTRAPDAVPETEARQIDWPRALPIIGLLGANSAQRGPPSLAQPPPLPGPGPSLGDHLAAQRYSALFRDARLIP